MPPRSARADRLYGSCCPGTKVRISSTVHPVCKKKDANNGEDAQNHCNHSIGDLKPQFLNRSHMFPRCHSARISRLPGTPVLIHSIRQMDQFFRNFILQNAASGIGDIGRTGSFEEQYAQWSTPVLRAYDAVFLWRCRSAHQVRFNN